jgi:CubicO group peptidase (beta-lactamase class C family)
MKLAVAHRDLTRCSRAADDSSGGIRHPRQAMTALPLVLAALLATAPPHAQDKAPAIDKIFSWVQPGMPGCLAAASQNGKLVVDRAYGLADLERNVPLTTESRLDAGSIRKQFVAAAVLVLVEEGKLSLSDDVRKYIPQLPDYGHTITIDHLLTHTSGIRDWVPLLNWASGDPDALSMILRQRGLDFVPGTEWRYSNSGYVLLPQIVARVSGMTFPEFLHARVLDPLGMTRSIYVDDNLYVIRNRALAYEKAAAGWRMDMRLGEDRGGGGALYTTASDLVRWFDALASGRLGPFVTAKIQEPAALSNGRTLTYARGLSLMSGNAGRVLVHGGGAAAYRSFAARFLDHDFSVAVMCNAGEASDSRDDFAGHIFDLFMADRGVRVMTPSAPLPPNAAGVEAADIAGKAGLFLNERTGDPLVLAAANGRLSVGGGGPLVAVTKDHFRNARPSTNVMSNDAFELVFASPDRFDLKSMEGATTPYRRAQPVALTAADLKALAGRYESDELRATLDITPGKTGLMARLNEARALGQEFRPVHPDLFQMGPFFLRFRRDEAGKVIALDMTNPVLRNIRFPRR